MLKPNILKELSEVIKEGNGRIEELILTYSSYKKDYPELKKELEYALSILKEMNNMKNELSKFKSNKKYNNLKRNLNISILIITLLIVSYFVSATINSRINNRVILNVRENETRIENNLSVNGFVNATEFGQFAWVDKLEQATAPPTPPNNTLRLYAESRDGFSVYKFIDDTGMVRELVRDSVFIVRNAGATNIPKMSAVYDCGSLGNYPKICLAQANNISKSQVIGITIEQINTSSFGRVMQVGLLENVNTDAFTEGNFLYLSDSQAGNLTTTPPLTPNLTTNLGTVLVKGIGNGAIQVLIRELTGDEFGTINNFIVQGNLTTQENLTVIKNADIFGNLVVNGNVSFKRPYGMYSSTETQTVAVIDTAYPMTFNWTEDSYLITKSSDNSNFSFKQTGEYLIELSVIATSSVAGKRVNIWVQKNGVNVPRSNTPYDFKSTNVIAVIAVPFIISMNTTDKFRVMYSGDDTGISIPYVTNTSFAPETPSIIMTITKISEVV